MSWNSTKMIRQKTYKNHDRVLATSSFSTLIVMPQYYNTSFSKNVTQLIRNPETDDCVSTSLINDSVTMAFHTFLHIFVVLVRFIINPIVTILMLYLCRVLLYLIAEYNLFWYFESLCKINLYSNIKRESIKEPWHLWCYGPRIRRPVHDRSRNCIFSSSVVHFDHLGPKD